MHEVRVGDVYLQKDTSCLFIIGQDQQNKPYFMYLSPGFIDGDYGAGPHAHSSSSMQDAVGKDLYIFLFNLHDIVGEHMKAK